MKTIPFYNPFTFRKITTCFCLVATLLLQPFESGYSQDASKRPSIGLVLSGGGAHVIAHLGVIKVMEKAHSYNSIVSLPMTAKKVVFPSDPVHVQRN